MWKMSLENVISHDNDASDDYYVKDNDNDRLRIIMVDALTNIRIVEI